MIPDHFLRQSFSLVVSSYFFPPPLSTLCHHHYPRNNRTVSQCETITRRMLCIHKLWNSEFICKHAPLISAGTLQNWWNSTSVGCCVECVIAKNPPPKKRMNYCESKIFKKCHKNAICMHKTSCSDDALPSKRHMISQRCSTQRDMKFVQRLIM